MTSGLRGIRLTWLQVAALALLSALATALIIASATGRTAAQTAALAALRQRQVVIAPHSSAPAAGDATLANASAPASSAPVTPAPAPAPAQQSSAASSGQSASPAPAVSTPSGPSTPAGPTGPAQPQPTKVKHVFVIALSTTSFEASFGRGSVAHYLNGTLKPKGTLLAGYQTLGQAELPDYLAMVGGQAPNPDTQSECSTYAEFPAKAKPDKRGLVPGSGCVYPNTAITIGDQVTASGHTWKAYIDGMGSSCVHPNSGAVDDVQLPGAGADYDTRHNPFIYFHSLLDLGDCATDDVDLSKLPAALGKPGKTPAYAFIAPGICADAASTSCPSGTASGLQAEDAFLQSWVPMILHSRAYKQSGALVIVFAHADASSSATGSAAQPVKTGALVLSPYARRGRTIATTYNPYSVLGSVEDLLGLAPIARAHHAKAFVSSALPRA